MVPLPKRHMMYLRCVVYSHRVAEHCHLQYWIRNVSSSIICLRVRMRLTCTANLIWLNGAYKDFIFHLRPSGTQAGQHLHLRKLNRIWKAILDYGNRFYGAL